MASYISIALIMLLITIPQPQYVSAYTVQEAALTVYRDGVVHVRVVASVDETEASIAIPLLSPRINGVLIYDEAGDLLDYDVEENNVVIYCLGATMVTLEYYTDGLTSKEAGLWTLTLNAPFDLSVMLPENATIIYLSAVPSAITMEENRITLSLYLGEWEISYELPMEAPSFPPEPPSPPSPPSGFTLTTEGYYMIAAAVACITIAFSAFLLVRWKNRIKDLRSEEIEVIRFLKERGGRALEAELRESFPDIPRTSMWRLIRRLEKQGVVHVRKVGLQNLVEIKQQRVP